MGRRLGIDWESARGVSQVGKVQICLHAKRVETRLQTRRLQRIRGGPCTKCRTEARVGRDARSAAHG